MTIAHLSEQQTAYEIICLRPLHWRLLTMTFMPQPTINNWDFVHGWFRTIHKVWTGNCCWELSTEAPAHFTSCSLCLGRWAMSQLRKSQGYHWSGPGSAVQGPKDWSRVCSWLCRYHLGVPATKDSGSKEVGDRSLVLDNYEDKDPDCGSALTRLKKHLRY